MKDRIKEILSSKNLVINEYVIRVAVANCLSLNEFLVLVYFANDLDSDFSLEEISNMLGLPLEDVMEAFNNLMMKGFVTLENVKDDLKRNHEVVRLDNIYGLIGETVEVDKVEEVKTDIFKSFEVELGRTLSPMELQLINGWLDSGTSEELILGALREAVYNGVNNFRYIDKIIYEWEKKGFKNMNDVDKHLKNRREKVNKDKEILDKEEKILDFDWLDT